MVGCQTLPCTPIRALVLCWSATVTSSGPARRVGKIPLIFRLLCFSFFLPPSLFSACFCRRLLFVVCGRSLSGFVVESFWLARPRLESNTELLLGVARAPTVRYRAVFGFTVFFFSCGRGSPTTLPQLLPLHLRMTKVLSAIFTRP